jgi:2-amino-4-hydroxy-6-hydroxymethyldihydropteridine diphosphokinase
LDRIWVTANAICATQWNGSTPRDLNCAVAVETELAPQQLLDHTQAVERAGGRTPTFRWGPRNIDIDILLYGGETIATDGLTIPHPCLRDRLFALRPLADLNAELSLPDGTPIRDLLQDPNVNSQGLRLWAHSPWPKP